VSALEGTSAILANFVRIISTKLIIREAEPTLYAPWMPDVDLLRDFDVVVDLDRDAEVANGALDLRVREQESNRPQISGPPIGQSWLRATQ
jgi:hypothetical protein